MGLIAIADIGVLLKRGGFDGLYMPGECACLRNDLAPCGYHEAEPGDDWINGCKPGYKHDDPRQGFEGEWRVSSSTAPMDAEAFALADME
jgi:hypothetical protein